MKSAGRYIKIHQGCTTAVYFLMQRNVPKAVKVFHHDLDRPVYFRNGRKRCISQFRVRADATRST